jgi:N6-adenosine-specific RNA methylase IME4
MMQCVGCTNNHTPRETPTSGAFYFKPNTNMQKHKYNIFPEMNQEDFERLKTDLSINGFDESQPIYIYQDAVLDGWNRLRACKELGISPLKETFIGSDIEAIEFVMRTNKRRNLTSSQWAAIAVEADDLIQVLRDEAKKRQAEFKGNQYTKPESGVPKLILEEQPAWKNEATQKLAETFNTNKTYISEAAKLKTERPEMFEKVKSGQKTLTEVKKEQKIEERKAYIEQQKKDIETGVAKLPEGVFEVIAIDPPWNYGREYDPESSRVANPYPEMTQTQLLEINIPSAKDSVLFLWTTHAFIFDAKELLDKWGFTYKACLVWDKQKIGMGAWFRMQCEFCLVGIKGKPIWNNTVWRDIIDEPRREHSRKPDIFYKMVDEITVGRKLEYFSRDKRNGWEVFGNETEKFK